jgi:hypothetical protein
MLMAIFSAGASYDSAQAYPLSPPTSQPWRPPLASGLFLDQYQAFGDIVRKYGKLSHIFPYLRELSGVGSVEEVLQSLLAEATSFPERLREFASVRYYLCELLTELTTKWLAQTAGVAKYAPLVADILRFNNSREPVCLVTFNYDLLLEHALYTFDFKRKMPADHLDSHPVLKLFKLHGSVEWARIVDLPSGTRLGSHELIDIADTLKLSDEFVLANPTNPHQMHTFGRPIFPAIAIPTQTKTEADFECPRAHLAELGEMLKSVTKVLIAGWQAKEAHFTQVLKSHLPKLRHIAVVGGNPEDANQTFRHFMDAIGQNEISAVRRYPCGGFTDFIVNRRGLEFFQA